MAENPAFLNTLNLFRGYIKEKEILSIWDRIVVFILSIGPMTAAIEIVQNSFLK